MKLNIVNAQNEKTGSIDMPKAFNEAINPDLIRTAVTIFEIGRKAPYGAFGRAGKQSVAKLSRRRRKYKGSYGIGISRVPRKIMSHSGTRFNWVGAWAPGTVGGRRAHPPKAFKILEKKLNKKENSRAIRSAIAGSMNRALVANNGYKVPESYPFVLDSSLEGLQKTKEVVAALKSVGFADDLVRGSIKKIRPGKGKSRSRPYRKKRSVLLIVSKQAILGKAARNIPGVETVAVNTLNISHLAPGSVPGRAVLFTKGAIEQMEKSKLFTLESEVSSK